MVKHQLQPQNSERTEFPGLWNTSWVRPYESLWSILNTYKAVNVIDKHTTLMNAIGADINAIVTNEYFLPCGIFCNISSTKNDINGIISKLTPKGYMEQLESFLSKREISSFFSDKILYCPKCMKSGYHSILHQLKGIKKCPFHPDIPLISYIKQRYVFGRQSSYEGGRGNFKRANIFFADEIWKKGIDFENLSELSLPPDWKVMPEIEDYFKLNGIRNDFDYIKVIGADLEDKDVIPEIGAFLLKSNTLKPDVILYNTKVSDQMVNQKMKKRAAECGIIYKEMSDSISRMRFKYHFLQIIVLEMLKPFSDMEIDYKCYQIERGQFISTHDELGIRLFFILLLIGDEQIEECLQIIKEHNDTDFFNNNPGYRYFPSDICIQDLNVESLCVSAQYYILNEYIRINWKKFKNSIQRTKVIEKQNRIHQNLILYPVHMIYVEQNEMVRIYRY